MSAQAETHTNELFLRFTVSERIEHIVLMISFGTLGLTGLIQKFNQFALAENLILLLGGIQTVRLIHRSAALLMALVSFYHVFKLTYRFSKRQIRPTMLPTLKDITDAYQMVMYFLGRRQERPLFDRYDFRQKFEYWALLWGNLVMGMTGFIMWFPIQATRFLPGEVIPAAKAAHGAEAVLAVMAILIWHMYSAHLNVDIFPMDASIFKGTLTKERMIHEHPLEYARIVEAERLAIEKETTDKAATADKVAAAEGAQAKAAAEKGTTDKPGKNT
jgi:formate dehydrogenase subunit gamma